MNTTSRRSRELKDFVKGKATLKNDRAVNRKGSGVIVATSRDRVSITSDQDETAIMSGRLWLIYHEIGMAVMDATDEDDTDVEELMKDIRRKSHDIAMAVLRARAIK